MLTGILSRANMNAAIKTKRLTNKPTMPMKMGKNALSLFVIIMNKNNNKNNNNRSNVWK